MAVFPECGFGEEIEGFAAVVLERARQYEAYLMYGGTRGEKTYRNVNRTPHTPKLLAENFLIY
jgi:hypothetical protein